MASCALSVLRLLHKLVLVREECLKNSTSKVRKYMSKVKRDTFTSAMHLSMNQTPKYLHHGAVFGQIGEEKRHKIRECLP